MESAAARTLPQNGQAAWGRHSIRNACRCAGSEDRKGAAGTGSRIYTKASERTSRFSTTSDRGGSLTLDDKFRIYAHLTFGSPALVLPAFGVGFQMLNPMSNYPRDWKDGAQAFGNHYGDKLAIITSRRTARFLADAALHEEPRYVSSTSNNVFARTLHALAFTVVDKADSGRNTVALGNLAGAAAGGFMGMF